MNLNLAKTLELPLEAATQTILIVGKRGSGKTSTAVRLAEQFAAARVPFVVVDPVDRWWGLKAAQDGRGPGIGVYVFGGQHADLPLESTAGGLIADVLVEHRISVVLSVKHFSGRERDRFVADLAARLFQRNTEPLHLFLEEAHEVAPQHPFKGEETMLHHIRHVWKLGRSSGLGGSAITQRPASLDKNITTQAEILVVHRTIGPQDVGAIREWIRYHGEREDILAQLASLKTGEAFIWAPDFPERHPIGLVRVMIHNRKTFDSSATPVVGAKRREPRQLAPVDLDLLRGRMAATLEKAKAEDPRELRRRIAEMERVNRAGKENVSAPAKRIEIPILKEQQLTRLDKALHRFHETASRLGGLEARINSIAQEISTALRAREALSEPVGAGTALIRPFQSSIEPARVLARPSAIMVSGDDPDHALTNPQQRILNAIAWQESIGVEEPTQVAVAFLAGYTFGGGSFNNSKGSLRTRGYVEYVRNHIRLTDKGRARAQRPEAPLTIESLHRHVLDCLPTPERRVLMPLLAAYPQAVSVEVLAEKAGYAVRAGAFNNPKGRLRSLGLIDYPQPGHVIAKGLLFLER